jgi:Mor family transcriptional regulator
VPWDGQAERNAQIYARRIQGFSLRAIAREFKLSAARVREIAMDMERKAKWRARAVGHGGSN